jgi:hypothetical protein
MNARPRPHRSPPPPEAPGDAPEAPPPSIVQRPDGMYYWIADEGRGEIGPFETYELAEADRDSAGIEQVPEPGESLREAEDEVGINAWIDSETGDPIEGQSPPHFEGD